MQLKTAKKKKHFPISLRLGSVAQMDFSQVKKAKISDCQMSDNELVTTRGLEKEKNNRNKRSTCSNLLSKKQVAPLTINNKENNLITLP